MPLLLEGATLWTGQPEVEYGAEMFDLQRLSQAVEAGRFDVGA